MLGAGDKIRVSGRLLRGPSFVALDCEGQSFLRVTVERGSSYSANPLAKRFADGVSPLFWEGVFGDTSPCVRGVVQTQHTVFEKPLATIPGQLAGTHHW